MGCTNSKTAKRAQQRDTLSQEAARETAKEREVAAADGRNAAAGAQSIAAEAEAAAPSPPAQVETAAGAGAGQTNPVDVELLRSAAPSSEMAAAAGPGEDPAKATPHHPHQHTSQRRGSSDSGHVYSHSTGAAAAPSASSGKSSRSRSRSSGGSGGSGELGGTRKHKSSHGKPHKHRKRSHSGSGRNPLHTETRSPASRAGSSASPSPPAATAAAAALPSHAGAAARKSSSSGSVDFDFASDSSPASAERERAAAAAAAGKAHTGPAVATNGHPDEDTVAVNAGRSLSPLSNPLDSASARSAVPSLAPASSVRGPSVHAVPAAAWETNSVSSRVPYEPYADVDLSDGDGRLPPYEWAPRTMPVPSPLRAAGAAADAVAPRWWGHDASDGPLPSAAAAVRFHDSVVRSAGADARPVHTLYPSLPPHALWSVSSVTESDRGLAAPVVAATTSYSPVESRAQEAGPRRYAMPPSLVDVYVSEEGGYQATHSPAPPPPASPPPPPVLAPYQHYPVPAPVSRYADPMPYARGPEVLEPDTSYIYGDADRGRSVQGVGAHQYKPVTYLFDSPTDGWLRSRRVPSPPQRELYAGAADLW